MPRKRSTLPSSPVSSDCCSGLLLRRAWYRRGAPRAYNQRRFYAANDVAGAVKRVAVVREVYDMAASVTSLLRKCLQPVLGLFRRLRARRNCAGGDPNSRLNTRLNAASEA